MLSKMARPFLSGWGGVATCAALWLLVVAPHAYAQAGESASTAPQRVGEVTLVIGQATLDRMGQAAASASIRKGEAIQSGDTIRTGANGHVHIRFVDGALISVRPQSVFEIQQFEYNPQQPQASVVKLSLTRGEVRSISGRAAESAKDRFRLNTPLVAIGVKGTDFVTQSAQDITRVIVNQGAIVMAPFDSACRADQLGVCSSTRARELSADMGGMALIYRSGSADPALLKLSSAKDAVKLQDATVLKEGDRNRSTSNETRRPEELLPQERLVWGRWNEVPNPGDALTVSFRQAMAGNEVTVGDGYYFLFREPGSANVLPTLNNRVDFKLQSSAATYRDGTNTLHAAKVDDASLRIDFGQRTFSTQLKVSSDPVGSYNLQFSGKLDPRTGVFLDRSQANAGDTLAGALTYNGLQAGYFFRYTLKPTDPGYDKTLPADRNAAGGAASGGSFSGATLWGR